MKKQNSTRTYTKKENIPQTEEPKKARNHVSDTPRLGNTNNGLSHPLDERQTEEVILVVISHPVLKLESLQTLQALKFVL